MRKFLVIVACFAIVVAGFWYFRDVSHINDVTTPTIRINDKDFSVLLADSDAERVKGLSGRTSLDENSLMLFVFERSDRYGIWMKDMNFPIDILWLNEQGTIIHMESNVSPATYPRTFLPPEKSLYIIEANAGFALENGLSVGKTIALPKK